MNIMILCTQQPTVFSSGMFATILHIVSGLRGIPLSFRITCTKTKKALLGQQQGILNKQRTDEAREEADAAPRSERRGTSSWKRIGSSSKGGEGEPTRYQLASGAANTISARKKGMRRAEA